VRASRGTARRAGVATLLVGLAVIALAKATGLPLTPPLYDGVFPIDAYKWLSPPPGEHGAPTSDAATVAVKGGRSPLLAIGTKEAPPQAQLFGPPGAMVLPAGTTEIRMSIAPIPAQGTPTDGHIEGNAYRISVTDQNGQPLTALASALVSVVLRGPGNLAEATVERSVKGSWQPLKTTPAGIGSTFIAVVTEFGDFTLVAPGPAPSYASSGSPGGVPSASGSVSSESPGPEASPPPAPSSAGDRTPLIVGLAVGAGLLAGAAVWFVTGRARNRG
jgi:hypothetical protein